MLTIYKASAGSGKTYTLTRQYLTILLGIKNESADDTAPSYRLNHRKYGPVLQNRHRAILAITFTNKATEEMKQRIVKELDALAHNFPRGHRKRSGHADALCTLFGCTDDELAASAAEAIKQLLLDFGNFNISTIDAFFQQVMRNMAYELDYPGDYQVSLDSNAVVSEGIGMMLDEFNTSDNPARLDSALAHGLRSLMTARRNQGSTFNPFIRTNSVHKGLVSDIASLFDEQYQAISRDFEAWLKTPDALRQLQEKCDSVLTLMRQKVAVAADNAYSALSGAGHIDADYINSTNILKPLAKAREGIMLTAANLKTKYAMAYDAGLDVKQIYKSKCDKFATPAITDAVNAFGRTYYDASVDSLTIGVLARQIESYRMMALALEYIQRFRRENNMIVLADTNELLNKIMDGDSQVPFVYEKMGVRLKHFLIDEFQDTSRLQWKNLRPLVDNGMAENADSLIIGDVKQAIYRFRNSDSKLLHTEVPDQYPEASLRGTLAADNTNWRSAPLIVRFNNTLFSQWSRMHNIPGYASVAQHPAARNAGLAGYIRVFTFDDDSLADAPDAEDVEATDREEAMLDTIWREIEREHNAGYHWREIAILVNTRTEAVKAAAKLLSKGIPVSTEEALLLRNSPAVSTIVNVMKLMSRAPRGGNGASRTPDIAGMCAVFDYLYASKTAAGSDEHTAAVEAIHTAFDKNVDTTEIMDSLGDIAADNPSTLTSLVESIVLRRLDADQRRTEAAYISAFHDVVIDYTAIYGNNLAGFVRYWQQNSRSLSIQSPDNADAVRIMTIHKSKGLEFECVHLAFANVPLTGRRQTSETRWLKTDPKWFRTSVADDCAVFPPYMRVVLDKDCGFDSSPFSAIRAEAEIERHADGMNKAYVAYTRPRRELMVYFEHQSPSKVKTMAEVTEILKRPLTPEFADTDLFTDLAAGNTEDGYVLGAPTVPVREDDDNEERVPEIDIDTYNVSVGGEGGAITAVEALFDEDTDENIDDENKNLTARMAQAAERGDRIHLTLCRIHKRGDLKHALQRALRRRIITDDEADEIKAMFADSSLAPYFDVWFEPGVRSINELTIYNPNAEDGHFTNRMDRVVWTRSGEIHIIDYKTAEHAGNVMTDDERAQLERYRSLMMRRFPDAVVRAFIVRSAQRLVLEL